MSHIIDGQEYYFKNKPYRFLFYSKRKDGDKWVPVVVYKCLYENPDGDIWVRDEKEFFEKFKTKD